MGADFEIYEHKEWLGLLQPVGLVVSPPALVKGQAVINRSRAIELQQKLREIVCTDPLPGMEDSTTAWISNFPTFAETILEWLPEDLVGAPGQQEIPSDLEVFLPDYEELLKPTYVVLDPTTKERLILIQVVKPGLPLDAVASDAHRGGNGWKAPVQAKFERLLRETQVPIGLLCNGTDIRLVYAPRGESSGHLTFPVQAMTEVPGRLILAALDMLLSADRVFDRHPDIRLPKLLSNSREYQAEVSTKLANQVLDALWELLRGLQMADAAVNGELLADLSKTQPQHIYGGLITTLMRLVFLLYAEDEGLMPNDAVYQRNYAISGLYERLREDASNYPDTMDQRYGSWATLLSLFRLVYDGGGATPEYLPARHGQLFDPDEFPFLEGRSLNTHYRDFPYIQAPRVPDGVLYRLLEKLLILEGERLSYRALDVEQIGSVYEAIMGFEVEVAQGLSIAVRPKDVVINVENILKAKAGDREKLLRQAECEISGKGLSALKEAKTVEDIVAALDRKVSSSRTPNLLPAGSLYLQPGEDRRRSGSHYTPRKLTQPIVEITLRPLFEQLGDKPKAEQILDLKICDLAMGSGAFLVETCRQLAEKLVGAWEREDTLKELPDHIEPLLLARRLVAQKCIYGVDRNPFAVNLAKLSLWLVTLAKDFPFTFLDHALKYGDSLVGVTEAEITSFCQEVYDSLPVFQYAQKLKTAKRYRNEIQTIDTQTDQEAEKKLQALTLAEAELKETRLIADVAVAAFFDGKNQKERDELQTEYRALVRKFRSGSDSEDALQEIAGKLRNGAKAIIPFHWEIEFTEVFDRDNGGFDVIIGNPPFAGKNTTINAHPEGYLDWLKALHTGSHGNSDIVAHFFRRAYTLLREGGKFGLIATNTIAQGDTRATGLRPICQDKGTIYNAQKRFKWIGEAAVVVSVVNVFKGAYTGRKVLDGREVSLITAFLFHAGGNEDPVVLRANADKSFQGSIVLGMGFTFDDSNPDATPISEMQRLIEKDARNAERIFPYIGGEEVNSSPRHAHRRYVINFGEMTEEESSKYPDLMEIIKEKVKPERDRLGDNADAKRRKEKWWLWGRYTPALFRTISQCRRVLVISRISNSYAFTFLPSGVVYNEKLVVFPFEKYPAFSILQSRIHEIWARFFSSTLKDDLQYTPSICFETFPFSEHWDIDFALETIGQQYYEFRADLMIRKNEGLTQTYNRFHDPDERDPDILRLRELHSQMDRAVLDAYGWTDIQPECEFILDYVEEEEKNSRRKKPYRFKWKEEVHDEVLARLLELNQKRAESERLLGKKDSKTKPKSGRKAPSKKTKQKAQANAYTLPLFPSEEA